jgi:tetratricopeptide (TPR) repeat protein
MMRGLQNDADAVLALASSLKSLSQIQFGNPQTQAAAIQNANAALSLLQQLPEAEQPRVLLKRAEVHHTIAVSKATSDPKGTVTQLRECIKLQRRAFEQDRGRTTAGSRLSVYQLQLGTLLRQLGQFDDAVAVATQRAEIWPKDAGYLYLAAVETAQARKDLLAAKSPPSNKDAAAKRYWRQALDYLSAALRAGFADAARIESETAWVPFHKDAEYLQLLQQIKVRETLGIRDGGKK